MALPKARSKAKAAKRKSVKAKAKAKRRAAPAAPRSRRPAGEPVPMPRLFTSASKDPFDAIAWETRTARIVDAHGKTVFEQEGVEVPAAWSQRATDLVASRYFAGRPGTKGRESSVRQLFSRVVDAIAAWVEKGRALAGPKEVRAFRDELAFLLLHQRAAFNSPVFFNVGVDEKPQASACFILSVEDDLDAILSLAATESRVFTKGGGAGTNFSSLRGSAEPTRSGGLASGPVSFLRGLDALAGAVKSGGRTRRAAKMAILDADHPDVLAFVRSKALEERRARSLREAGLADGDVASEAAVGFQNENHSVRVPDAFLRAAEANDRWRLVPRTPEGVETTVAARALLREIAEAAHACGDPGLHFADTIEGWNPVPAAGVIRASNPCSEFMFLDDTACNLASLNLLAFRRGDGSPDVRGLAHAAQVLVLAMEAIVSNASYPTPAIARNSERLRPLGLGVANLGALLTAGALPYDSDAGRALAAGLLALVGGEATRASARLAERLGPHAEWKANRAASLAVLSRHREAADGLDASLVPQEVRAKALEAWHRAEARARRHGLRNAQVTCVAPTGTIAFLMDCDTTGVEPDLALVKEKSLVGGGRLRIASGVVDEALERLGHAPDARRAILAHVEATGSVEGAPGIAPEHLAVFDTAVPARPGGRALSPRAHLAMMAAIQPFVSGAISKTVNLPSDATVEEVERVFLDAWRMGLKAVAVYRDRSKVAQPLVPAPAHGEASSRVGSPGTELEFAL